MRSRSRDRARSRDEGVTLVELLVSIGAVGTLVAAISAALVTVLRVAEPTEARIAESKDITFLQVWLPNDLASATESERSPTYQLPGSPLPGTNVLTLRRPGDGGSYYHVSYRYVDAGDGEWQLRRYEIRNAGLPNQEIDAIGVAYEMPAPPPGWTPDQSPVHAIEVTARNQVILRPIGEDIRVTFASGQEFTTGGAGLSSEDQLPTDYSGGFTDPSAPPSRCGGTIALVLDTSGSVPQQRGGEPLKQAAASFIDAFTGTPSRIAVVGFDRAAYHMAPASAATYVPMLQPSPQLTAVKNRILQIDNRDGNWNQSNPDAPVADGVHWDQIGAGTNWEDGLWLPFRTNSGAPQAALPDLVVFITDGMPSINRAGSTNSTQVTNAAVAVANYGRGTGARIVGILVGNQTNTTNINRLKQVVGNNQWNGTGPSNPGNAAAADIFIPGNGGSFGNLGPTLRSLMVAQCGGTVTLQKRIDTGGGNLEGPTTTWTYTTDVGVRELNPNRENSITFDYAFASGQTSRVTTITETPQPGFRFDRAECSVGGVPLDPSRLTYPADGTPAVQLDIRPDEALSCVMISVPA